MIRAAGAAILVLTLFPMVTLRLLPVFIKTRVAAVGTHRKMTLLEQKEIIKHNDPSKMMRILAMLQRVICHVIIYK